MFVLKTIRPKDSILRSAPCLKLGCLLIGAGIAVNAHAAARFYPLGDLPGGIFESHASVVSADGLVVVGSASSASGSEAFRWSITDGMSGLGDLPGGAHNSVANDVSADGSVIVGQGVIGPNSFFDTEAFIWTAQTGMMGMGDLPGGVFRSAANGISADGSIVVGTGFSASDNEAFRWTVDGGMAGIGFINFPNVPLPFQDNFSTANDVSADGSVVAGSCNPFPAAFSGVACRWTESTGMISLGILPNDAHSPSSWATAVSADGAVVVGSSTSDTGGPPDSEAFHWTASGGMVGLGFIPGPTYGLPNQATAVSADGSVIVGNSDSPSGGQQAFLWTADDGIRLLQDILTDLGLNLTGWTLTSATGISDDGLTIVGTGINPNGDTEAFIATLPEPGTLIVIALGLPALLRRGR